MEESMRSAQPVEGRAESDEEKQEVIDRLLLAWRKQPKLRLGQLIHVATDGCDIFNAEDFPLLQSIELYAKCERK